MTNTRRQPANSQNPPGWAKWWANTGTIILALIGLGVMIGLMWASWMHKEERNAESLNKLLTSMVDIVSVNLIIIQAQKDLSDLASETLTTAQRREKLKAIRKTLEDGAVKLPKREDLLAPSPNPR